MNAFLSATLAGAILLTGLSAQIAMAGSNEYNGLNWSGGMESNAHSVTTSPYSTPVNCRYAETDTLSSHHPVNDDKENSSSALRALIDKHLLTIGKVVAVNPMRTLPIDCVSAIKRNEES